MDLLSDDSDSFFEVPKIKKTSHKNKNEKSKSLQNLFGILNDKPSTAIIESSVKETTKTDADWLGLGEDLLNEDRQNNVTENFAKSNIPASSKSSLKLIKKISFEDDDDLLGGLGLDKQKNVNEEKDFAAKKSAILEDLLGETKQDEKKITTFDDILQIGQHKRQLESTSGLNELTADSKEFSSSSLSKPSGISAGYAPSSAGRESRRLKHATSNVTDPLGIFRSTSEIESEKLQENKYITIDHEKKASGTSRPTSLERLAHKNEKSVLSQRSISFDADITSKAADALSNVTIKIKDTKAASSPNLGLPNWLGGTNELSTLKSNASEPFISVNEQNRLKLHEDKLSNEVELPAPNPTIKPNFGTQSQNLLLTQNKLSSSNLEYQNSQIALQQQESQLLMALQMKKYEDNLAEIQRSQQDLITKQEQQFNSLLERQFAKQQIMENNMRLQQERINSHIQLLLTQQPVRMERLSENDKQFETIKKASPETDANEFREIVNNLKQKHAEEMFLMDESYKKQISLIEQNMESMENRLKQDTENITKHYDDKIQKITLEQEKEINKYKEKIEELLQLHQTEKKKLRENYARMCEEIRLEYSIMVENIKESRKTERMMLENSEDYAEKLGESLKLLDSNNRALSYIKSEVEIQHQTNVVSKETMLKTKEDELKVMKTSLEKVQDQMTQERTQLMGLIQGLEMKLAEQTQATREEQWALQQATAVLTARSVALDRELEFSRNATEREREQIKVLKETLLMEQENNILKITEEKLALAREKAKLETSSKLANNYDVAKARAEIDAAIQVAKEATEMTDRERERLQKQQCELESIRRQLRDRELKLETKEKDLNQMERNSTFRLQEGKKMKDEAKVIEMKYKEKMREIQQQLETLKYRERKMNEDKMCISKERLALQQFVIKNNKKCGLCNVENNPDESTNFSENVAELEIPKYSISNPELLRFRLSLGLENDDVNNENDQS